MKGVAFSAQKKRETGDDSPVFGPERGECWENPIPPVSRSYRHARGPRRRRFTLPATAAKRPTIRLSNAPPSRLRHPKYSLNDPGRLSRAIFAICPRALPLPTFASEHSDLFRHSLMRCAWINLAIRMPRAAGARRFLKLTYYPVLRHRKPRFWNRAGLRSRGSKPGESIGSA